VPPAAEASPGGVSAKEAMAARKRLKQEQADKRARELHQRASLEGLKERVFFFKKVSNFLKKKKFLLLKERMAAKERQQRMFETSGLKRALPVVKGVVDEARGGGAAEEAPPAEGAPY
jgi:hypothetical protein